MGDGSTIEWTDATWNPVRGCSRVSEGCRNCYAEGVARRFSGPGQPYEGLVRIDAEGRAKAQWNGSTRFVPEHLADPLRWKRPRRIFVNSMSDLFHESLTDDAIDAVVAVMMLAPHHVFQVLTKRPERMRRYLSDASLYSRVLRAANALRNDRPELTMVGISDPARGLPRWIWLGVSVEDQATADERIPVLLDTPAAVRWVSYEPALGPVDFWPFFSVRDAHGEDSGPRCNVDGSPALGWIVVGGESGPGARPFDLAWARSTIAQCREAGVPVFVKQLGSNAFDPARCSWHPPDERGEISLWETGHQATRLLASVWDHPTSLPPHATWHTWDARGIGGENASEPTLEAAKRAVEESLVRQHVHAPKDWARHRSSFRDRKGGDMAEWPADLRVREMPL